MGDDGAFSSSNLRKCGRRTGDPFVVAVTVL